MVSTRLALGVLLAASFFLNKPACARRADPAPRGPSEFQCEADGAGRRCRGRLGGAYPKDVVLFYSSWPPPSNPELILYFHGFNQSFDEILRYFNFGRLLADSRRSGAILVVPDGTGAAGEGYFNQTYAAQFQAGPGAAARFRRFVSALEKAVGGNPSKRFLVLAGHSGAGWSALFRILDCAKGGICWKGSRELYLIDAAYNSVPPSVDFRVYADFAAAPGHRFVSVYSDTKDHNIEIWQNLADPPRHREDFKPLPGNIDAAALRASTPAFVASDVGHMETVVRYLPLLLEPAPPADRGRRAAEAEGPNAR